MVKDLQITGQGSATEPVTVTELKEYLQIEGSAFNNVLTAMISASRKMLENRLNVCLIDSDAVAYIELCEKPEQVPYYPVNTVDTVEFTDDGGETWETLTEFDDYIITGGDRQMIEVYVPGLYRLTYSLNATDAPDLIEAVKVQAGYMWTHRDAANVKGISPIVEIMIKPYEPIF